MTTLATLPALFAVALSISSADDYHYVSIPTNMAASLTGVGMGADAPSSDAPLRYEDAAFLAEAYLERAGGARQKPEITSVVYYPKRAATPSKFIKPSLLINGGLRVAPDTPEYSDFICNFFGTTNIYVDASENKYDTLVADEQKANTNRYSTPTYRLKPDYIRALYADLSNYSRRTADYDGSSSTNKFIKKYKSSPSNYRFSDLDGWLPLSEGEDRTEVSDSSGLQLSFYVQYSAKKEKAQCYEKGDDGKWAKHGQEGNFTIYSSDRAYSDASGSVALKLGIPYIHGGSGMLCCMGYVSTTCYVNDGDKENSGRKYFYTAFPVSIRNDGTNAYAVVNASDVGMSLDSGTALLKTLCGKFNLPFYASSDDLLGVTSQPGSLPTASELDGDESLASKTDTSSVKRFNSYYQASYLISQTALILDIEYNARLGGDGSSGGDGGEDSSGGDEGDDSGESDGGGTESESDGGGASESDGGE